MLNTMVQGRGGGGLAAGGNNCMARGEKNRKNHERG